MVNRLNNHRQLDNLTNLEQTRLSRKSLDLMRITLNTIGYGVAGRFFSNHPELVVPTTAGIGFALTLYDEYKEKGMDLCTPAVGIFIGGGLANILFHQTDAEEFMPYVGAVIGGALGMYNSWRERTGK